MLSAGQGGIIRLGTNWEASCLFTRDVRNLLLQNATRFREASRALAATTPLESKIAALPGSVRTASMVGEFFIT
jgi:hypothetical protein